MGDSSSGSADRPAFYALEPGGWRDWWSLLHPPYTVWHLSYVVIGASLAPDVDVRWLGETLLAFFLAMGLAAHALDELHGRPLRTQISDAALVAVAVVGLAGAVALGIDGMIEVSLWLGVFIAVGSLPGGRVQPRAVRRRVPFRPLVRAGVGSFPGAHRVLRADSGARCGGAPRRGWRARR